MSGVSDDLHPLVFKPLYTHQSWGGTRIASLYRRAATGDICAESWEIADREPDMSVVAGGPLRDESLNSLYRRMGHRLTGIAGGAKSFPLLIKIIDARERLSLQVHPDDESAKLTGGEPKTEMWYALRTEPGAYVYLGTQPGVDAREFAKALRERRVAEVLQRFPVKAGDVVFVPGGRVHAIGEGCLFLEVQQNSDTTYRLCDWDRVGPGQKRRPLHIRKAMKVIRWDDHAPTFVRPRTLENSKDVLREELLTCPYFRMERLALNASHAFRNPGKSFHALFISQGAVDVIGGGVTQSLHAGTSCLLPAALRAYASAPRARPCEVLRISVPATHGSAGARPAIARRVRRAVE